ncbi:hypothetical protein PCASD_00824 [Puccinia coronata f. sp. avenae]|uniref:Uncharacterized protein n=1 Tax=Puccinia coronata f. sp. avenae TaxID=200324 RepID=A0A2N5VP90_9BASI|nr:hypothetical protein PCASD_00824 [Puccinia coronata f. sp. avenae]
MPNSPKCVKMVLLKLYPGQALFLAEQLGNSSLETSGHPCQMWAPAAMVKNPMNAKAFPHLLGRKLSVLFTLAQLTVLNTTKQALLLIESFGAN